MLKIIKMSDYEDYESQDSWDEWEDEENDDEIDNAEEANIVQRRGSFTIIESKEIENNINQLVEEYSELLGISKDEAYILLSHFQWKP